MKRIQPFTREEINEMGEYLRNNPPRVLPINPLFDVRRIAFTLEYQQILIRLLETELERLSLKEDVLENIKRFMQP